MNKIEHLQYLSKLSFPEEEKAKFEKEFENILGFVNTIAEIELPEDLEKDKAISMQALREDEVAPSLDREKILQNAPKQKDGCYNAPLVIE